MRGLHSSFAENQKKKSDMSPLAALFQKPEYAQSCMQTAVTVEYSLLVSMETAQLEYCLFWNKGK